MSGEYGLDTRGEPAGTLIDASRGTFHPEGSTALLVYNIGGSILSGGSDAVVISSRPVAAVGLVDPHGIPFDDAGTLSVLNAGTAEIVRVEAGRGTGSFATGTATRVSLSSLGSGPFAGLGYNPDDGLLHVINTADLQLYGVTASGAVASMAFVSSAVR